MYRVAHRVLPLSHVDHNIKKTGKHRGSLPYLIMYLHRNGDSYKPHHTHNRHAKNQGRLVIRLPRDRIGIA